MSVRLGRFTTRHRTMGALLHRLVHRGWNPYRSHQGGCVVCRSVWAHFEADHPDFIESIQQGLKEADEHRVYVQDGSGGWVPHPDWPKDGEQPRANPMADPEP